MLASIVSPTFINLHEFNVEITEIVDYGEEEENKGNTIVQEAASLMQNSHFSSYYAGYVEGDKIISGDFDIVICDGFSGNVMLKTAEGTAKFVTDNLKKSLNENKA